MKKIIWSAFLAVALISCEQKEEKKVDAKNSELKIGFVDTAKLMEESLEAKDLNAKYEEIVKTKAASLQAEKSKFQNEVLQAEKSAQQMGPQWVQAKMREFQEKEQRLAASEQRITVEIQQQSGKEMDSLVKKIKGMIKDYAKEKKFDYILGTGEVSTVLYGKEETDLTEIMIKNINENYTKNKKKE
ncbi:MAG: OmpH family outer membrane protein [Flavobacteriales bacterium]|nr:OmpH family outer membrane protein [Flavobacteriales bacterium]